MKRFIAPFFLIFLAACAQFGVAPADTFNKKLAAAYVTVETVADTAFALRASGAISPEEKAKVASVNDTALEGLAAAKSLSLTDPFAAETRLTSAIALLTAIQAFLATKGSK